MKSKQLNVKCERVLVDIPDSDLYVSWNLFLNTLAGVFPQLTVPYILCFIRLSKFDALLCN